MSHSERFEVAVRVMNRYQGVRISRQFGWWLLVRSGESSVRSVASLVARADIRDAATALTPVTLIIRNEECSCTIIWSLREQYTLRAPSE